MIPTKHASLPIIFIALAASPERGDEIGQIVCRKIRTHTIKIDQVSCVCVDIYWAEKLAQVTISLRNSELMGLLHA